MDSVRYAEAAADLVNGDLAAAGDLARVLEVHSVGVGVDDLDERDLKTLRRFQRELRTAFERGGESDDDGVVTALNELLVRHPVVPVIEVDAGRRHLGAHDAGGSPVRHLVAESLLALATLACEQGPSRLGVCGATRCENVFVDTSPNASRRYCSDRCSSRANVAAYRARQKAARRDARGSSTGVVPLGAAVGTGARRHSA